MFSRRLHWDLPANRLSQLLAEKRAAGARILDLTESNPTRAGLSYPSSAAAALADVRALDYDPQPAGSLAAREAVSRYYAAAGHVVKPDRILLTASTSEGYAYLFKLLANPGDEVLVPRPSYPLFDYLAALESVQVVHYPLVYHGGWSIDCDALKTAVTTRTRAIVLVNPNNPTGSFLKRDEQEILTALCREHDLALISDEVFADYGFAEDERRVRFVAGSTDALAFSMSGLSKVAGLPQMKLGWIVVGGAPDLRASAMNNLELIADTYLSVGSPVQHAAPQLLDLGAEVQSQIVARTRANLQWLRSAIGSASACRVLEVEGGWYATLQVPRVRSEEEWTLGLLREANVLVQPGFFYDFASEAFLVVSLLTEPDTFKEGAGILINRVDQA